jgi:hypothetical protein
VRAGPRGPSARANAGLTISVAETTGSISRRRVGPPSVRPSRKAFTFRAPCAPIWSPARSVLGSGCACLTLGLSGRGRLRAGEGASRLESSAVPGRVFRRPAAQPNRVRQTRCGRPPGLLGRSVSQGPSFSSSFLEELRLSRSRHRSCRPGFLACSRSGCPSLPSSQPDQGFIHRARQAGGTRAVRHTEAPRSRWR